jgi:hypothetical protein
MSIERVTSGLSRLLQLPLCAKLNAKIREPLGRSRPVATSTLGAQARKAQVNVPAIKSFGLRTCWQIGSAIFLAAVVCLCANARAASPDDWQRLPDGRVVIELKDVRIALPHAGPDTQLITFSGHGVGNSMTLQEAIERPAAARRLFQSQSVISVFFTIRSSSQGQFLGRFPRSDLRSVMISVGVGQGVLGGCQSWAETFSRLTNSVTPRDESLASNGWNEFKLSERPPTVAYVRSPRDSEKAFFPGISCNYFKSCSSTKCLSADVNASFRFNATIIEQRHWLSLDQTVGRLLAYVLIDLGTKRSGK